jgi:lipopolysaccharide biosynthesis glycosyltransferase
MERKPMNIVIAVNRHYVRYSYIMLTSLLINNPAPVHVYVLHHDLLPEDENTFAQLCDSFPVTFHYCYLSDELLPPADIRATNSWGLETYFRLAIIDVLPHTADRALYIDSDMIINRSLDEFYYCSFGDKKIAACRDFICNAPFGDYRDDTFQDVIPDGFTYFNAGLTLFYLDALRKEYNFSRYMDAAKELDYRIHFPDQDLLNYCHRRDVLFFDAMQYNLYVRRAYTDYGIHYNDVKQNTTVIHYATAKPWQGNFLHCDIEQLWWDYAAKTPFYHELLAETMREIMMDSTVNTYITNLQEENKQLYHIIEQYEHLLKKSKIL